MEVVSPRLDTKQPVSRILGDFWEAMRVHFSPQRDISCGGHVHVTPVSSHNKFSLRSLKKIAFASAVYEEFVAAVLPRVRRENQYCRPNSQSTGSGLHETLMAFGRSKNTLMKVAADIKSKTSERDLCYYMQGNRYVLWNFANIFPNPKTGKCTGTVEFRGGNQFLSTNGTLAWVAFVMGFITLALEEVSSGAYSYILSFLTDFQDLIDTLTTFTSSHDPKFQARLESWWKRIRQAAKASKLSRFLPEEYIAMNTR